MPDYRQSLLATTSIPDSPLDIDLKFGLLIVAFLIWAWFTGLVLVMVFRTAVSWKRHGWRFSIWQILTALTVVAIVIGLSASLAKMW